MHDPFYLWSIGEGRRKPRTVPLVGPVGMAAGGVADGTAVDAAEIHGRATSESYPKVSESVATQHAPQDRSGENSERMNVRLPETALTN